MLVGACSRWAEEPAASAMPTSEHFEIQSPLFCTTACAFASFTHRVGALALRVAAM